MVGACADRVLSAGSRCAATVRLGAALTGRLGLTAEAGLLPMRLPLQLVLPTAEPADGEADRLCCWCCCCCSALLAVVRPLFEPWVVLECGRCMAEAGRLVLCCLLLSQEKKCGNCSCSACCTVSIGIGCDKVPARLLQGCNWSCCFILSCPCAVSAVGCDPLLSRGCTAQM